MVGARSLEKRKITFGRSDYFHCEVLTGLSEGEYALSLAEAALAHHDDDEHAIKDEKDTKHDSK